MHVAMITSASPWQPLHHHSNYYMTIATMTNDCYGGHDGKFELHEYEILTTTTEWKVDLHPTRVPLCNRKGYSYLINIRFHEGPRSWVLSACTRCCFWLRSGQESQEFLPSTTERRWCLLIHTTHTTPEKKTSCQITNLALSLVKLPHATKDNIHIDIIMWKH